MYEAFSLSAFENNTFLVGSLEIRKREGILVAGPRSTGLYTKLLGSSKAEDGMFKAFLVYRVSLRLVWKT